MIIVQNNQEQPTASGASAKRNGYAALDSGMVRKPSAHEAPTPFRPNPSSETLCS